MIGLVRENNILTSANATQLQMDVNNKVIIYEKNKLIFIFNFNPANSIFGYRFRAPEKGTYTIVLNSDRKEFGGFDRVNDSIDYAADGHQNLSVYLTNRTALVMKKKA
ncbi:MAG: alpha amylase C-terminal domain-containing protein [Ferruginibacter sp.]